MATLWAVADLHAAVRANAPFIDAIIPTSPQDVLLVAGDVAESIAAIVSVLKTLRGRFSQVVWSPGNHELFAHPDDLLTGRAKYDDLVARCRDLDILTPEDPFIDFGGRTIVPLFTLYDYSFRRPGMSVEEALEHARRNRITFTDEVAIAPYVNIREWCRERLEYSVKRLSALSGSTIMINHWPLCVEPLANVRWPDLSLWCGSVHTRRWPVRYSAEMVIYGHLHMPSIMTIDGVKHMEVSPGYPRDRCSGLAHKMWPVPIFKVGR